MLFMFMFMLTCPHPIHGRRYGPQSELTDKHDLLQDAACALRGSYDTTAFARHVDGTAFPLQRTYELVSLHPFQSHCPVSTHLRLGDTCHTCQPRACTRNLAISTDRGYVGHIC